MPSKKGTGYMRGYRLSKKTTPKKKPPQKGPGSMLNANKAGYVMKPKGAPTKVTPKPPKTSGGIKATTRITQPGIPLNMRRNQRAVGARPVTRPKKKR